MLIQHSSKLCLRKIFLTVIAIVALSISSQTQAKVYELVVMCELKDSSLMDYTFQLSGSSYEDVYIKACKYIRDRKGHESKYSTCIATHDCYPYACPKGLTWATRVRCNQIDSNKVSSKPKIDDSLAYKLGLLAWYAQVCESSAIYKLHAFLEPYNFTLTKFEDMRIAQSGYGTGEEMGCHTAKYFLMDNGLL